MREGREGAAGGRRPGPPPALPSALRHGNGEGAARGAFSRAGDSRWDRRFRCFPLPAVGVRSFGAI